MKAIKFLIIAVTMAIILTGCTVAPKAVDNRFPCTKDKKEIYNAIDKIMKEEGLRFLDKKEASNNTEHYTYSTGQIETVGYLGSYETVWEYWYDEVDKQIYTIPMQLYYNGAYSNGTVVYNDTFDGAFVSYWNVRAKLEKLCDCKAIVTFYKPAESMKEQSLGK